MGAPIGNKNAVKNRIWSDAIRRAVLQGKRLDKLAEAIITAAEGGDITALKEIGDRLEGKATQVMAGENGPVELVITWAKEAQKAE
jgi:ribosomal protein L17